MAVSKKDSARRLDLVLVGFQLAHLLQHQSRLQTRIHLALDFGSVAVAARVGSSLSCCCCTCRAGAGREGGTEQAATGQCPVGRGIGLGIGMGSLLPTAKCYAIF